MKSLPDNLVLLEKGAQSQIYLAKAKDPKQNFILKTVDVLHIKQANHLLNQYKLLSKLNHENIVKPLLLRKNYSFMASSRHILIFNYAKYGNLLQFIKNWHQLDVSQTRFIFKSICSAVSYLHSEKIAHRDLKLQNILVFQDNMKKIKIKISDFGLSQSFWDQQDSEIKMFNSFKGTKRGYMAPEIYSALESNQSYDASKSDIFSLGVILFALLFKRLPFEFANSKNNIYKLIQDQNFDKFWEYHSKQISKVSNQVNFMQQELKDLLKNLLQENPQKRHSIKQLEQHQWMKGQTKQIVPKIQ